jgi:HEAT repeat protein
VSGRGAERGRRIPETKPMGRKARLACSLGVVGAVLVIIGLVMSTSYEGLSTGTWLHLVGVLILAAAGALSVPALIRNSKTDARGWPTLGILAILFLGAVIMWTVNFGTESEAGDVWTKLLAVLEKDEPGAALEVVREYRNIPAEASDLRLKFVQRIGELGDTRAAHFLETMMKDGPDPALRKAASVGLGGMAGPERIDGLIRGLRGVTTADRDLILQALRLAADTDAGKTHGDWLRWRLLQIVDGATPETIVDLVVNRLRDLRPTELPLYEEIRGRLCALTDPALAPAFEKILRTPLEGARRLDRKAVAVITLGRIAEPRSIKPLKDAFAWTRREIAAEKMSPKQANGFWNAIGKSLRLIARAEVLDAERWPPVFEFFLGLVEDKAEQEVVRNFAADELERMSGEKHGLDPAAWKSWREDETVKAHAAAGNVTALITDMNRCVNAKDIPRAARAIRALVGTGGDAAYRALRVLVLRGSVEASIRMVALDALVKAKKTLERKDLLTLLEKEEHQGILRSVVLALAVIDEDPIAEALHERYLVEEDVVLRRTIVDALREMTVDAVLPALVAAVRDEIPAVAAAAAKELEARTMKRFGVDPDKWEEWYDRNFKK